MSYRCRDDTKKSNRLHHQSNLQSPFQAAFVIKLCTAVFQFFIPNTMVLPTSHSRAFLSKYLITEMAVTSSRKKGTYTGNRHSVESSRASGYISRWIFAQTSFVLHFPLLVWCDSAKNFIWYSHMSAEECTKYFYLIADGFKCVFLKTDILNLLETHVNVA